MQFMLAIYEDPSAYADEQVLKDIIKAHGAYSEMLAEAGVIRGGEELGAPEEAKTVRKSGGKTTVHAGPYAEMQEQLGGFYIIETDTMEDALAWAAKLPMAGNGSVEVRPCMSGHPE